jgi:hypothetical protein
MSCAMNTLTTKKWETEQSTLQSYCLEQEENVKALQLKLSELEKQLDDANHSLKECNAISAMSKERPIGRRGGASKWPPRVVQLVCEMLVNGTPPSAIPANIASLSAYQTGKVPESVPSLSFVRECRVVCQVIAECLAAFRLGKAEKWLQTHTDATSRRQIAFQNLIISIRENNKIISVILSSCIFLNDEKSETIVQALIKKVRKCDINMY